MELIKNIQEKINSGLPGSDTQYEMAPLGRAEFANSVKNYTEAAVLCLLYPKFNEWHMVFIQRTSHDKDKHSAQIAFPGGKMEKEDKTYIETAMREANEEVGVKKGDINIIGELTPLKIPVSKFEVFPVLAYTEIQPIFIPQVSEVAKIIEVNINELINPANRKSKNIKLSNGVELENVPVFEFEENIIWGATSMILNEAIHIIKS